MLKYDNVDHYIQGVFYMGFLLYGSVIASMVLYGSTISIIKRIKDDRDISGHMFFSILSVGFITYTMLMFIISS